MNIAPYSKAALKLSFVEKRGHPSVEHYFNHVSVSLLLVCVYVYVLNTCTHIPEIVFECGDPYIIRRRQTRSKHTYTHTHIHTQIVFECGDPYIFVEDKLVSALAKFAKSLQTRRSKEVVTMHARGLHENVTAAGQQQTDKGVPANIGRMVSVSCMRASVTLLLNTYSYLYIYIYIHTYIHTYIHICRHTYVCMYVCVSAYTFLSI